MKSLMGIPNVGIDIGSGKISPKNILRLKGNNAFLEHLLLIGGVINASEVSDLLGVDLHELHSLKDQSKLIAISFDESDQDYYPAFQFSYRKNEDGSIVDNFSDILSLLQSDSPIDSIMFFTTPDVDLDGDAPINVLKKGENKDMVKRLARQFGRQVAK